MKNIGLLVLLAVGGLYLARTQFAIAQSTPPSTQPATVYSCPMHPEVVSDKPGKCPKCGMNLTPKKQ